MLSDKSFEGLHNIRVDFVHASEGVHLLGLSECLVLLYDGHGLILESCKSLFQRFDVVVIPATRFAALQDPCNHGVFVSIQEEDEGHIHDVSHDSLPSLLVVQVSGEAVNKELFSVPSVFLHSLLE
jgi:hypothetical protein